MKVSPKQIFQIMEGVWEVERKIDIANKGDSISSIRGTAEFKLQGSNCLVYYEDFIVGDTVRGHKKYKYYLDPESDSVTKRFEDDSLFYDLSVTPEQIGGEHLCSKDMYYSKYFFHSKDLFEINYSVVGPNKNYNIYSRYTRRE